MLGFFVVNLVVPDAPSVISIPTPSGGWAFHQLGGYVAAVAAMGNNQCAHTYTLESQATGGAAIADQALEEVTPLLLGASYLTGLSVTVERSMPLSKVQLFQSTNMWPRARAMGAENQVTTSDQQFAARLEKFVVAWPHAGQQEKVLILVHHWLDALACWSFEDLYLSATTLLQIIAATEGALSNTSPAYFNGVTAAAARAGIVPLSRDFKDLRNNLIHEGKLLGGKFVGTTLDDCAVVAADVLNWFDAYMHSKLALGAVSSSRFSKHDFQSLNAYSL